MKITLDGEEYITQEEAAKLTGLADSEAWHIVHMSGDIHIRDENRYYSKTEVLTAFEFMKNSLVTSNLANDILKAGGFGSVEEVKKKCSDFPEPVNYMWPGGPHVPLWRTGDILAWREKIRA